ncbi:MAG: hypothetical protein ABIJ09_23080 [Pseudomonadota bacterium]
MRNAMTVGVLGLLWSGLATAQETRDMDLGGAIMPSESGSSDTAADRVEQYIPSAVEELPIEERPTPKADGKDYLPFLWERFKVLHSRGEYLRACDDLETLHGAGEDMASSRDMAGRSYLECARLRAEQKDGERATVLLARSEELIGQVDERKRVVGPLARQRSDAALAKGDLVAAVTAFDEALQLEPDATDRLEFSTRLAILARAAYGREDIAGTEKALAAALKYFPSNMEAQQLKRQLWLRANMGWMVGGSFAGVLLLVVATMLWRRAAAGRYKNIDLDQVPDLGDDDDDALEA